MYVGGSVVETWENCTHVVMNEFVLTAKGLMAAVHGKVCA